MQGMQVEDPNGNKQFALKATGWMTNASYMLDELAVVCDGSHVHGSLENGRAASAAVYPDKLCYSILRGLRTYLNKDLVMFEGELGTVCEDVVEKQFFQELASREVFIDDISKKVLDPHLVKEARRDEVKGVFNYKLFDKVPIK